MQNRDEDAWRRSAYDMNGNRVLLEESQHPLRDVLLAFMEEYRMGFHDLDELNEEEEYAELLEDMFENMQLDWAYRDVNLGASSDDDQLYDDDQIGEFFLD